MNHSHACYVEHWSDRDTKSLLNRVFPTLLFSSLRRQGWRIARFGLNSVWVHPRGYTLNYCAIQFIILLMIYGRRAELLKDLEA